MIRVTLTLDMPDWWGADESWADGGAGQVKELVKEDVQAFAEDATWTVEKVENAPKRLTEPK